MTLVMLALLAGCLFYIAQTAMEYRAFEMAQMPVLDELARKIGQLSATIDTEKPLVEEARLRVAALRESREEVMLQVEEARHALLAENARHQTLSVEAQKQAFRGTLARGRKLALK